MKLICFLVFSLFTFHVSFSQRIPKKYKKYFKNCCNPKKTTIRSLIDIDGYYSLNFIRKKTNKILNDTNTHNILFYDNGFCVSGWGIYANNIKEVSMEIEKIIKNGSKDWFYKTTAWGNYEVKGDTIITCNIIYGTFMRPVSMWETLYKVVNRTTIVEIYDSTLTPINNELNQNLKNVQNDYIYMPANFVPLNNLPVSDFSWLRRQKCVSCDSIDLTTQ